MTTKNFGILIHGGASGSNKRRITKQYSNRGQGCIAKAIEQAAYAVELIF